MSSSKLAWFWLVEIALATLGLWFVIDNYTERELSDISLDGEMQSGSGVCWHRLRGFSPSSRLGRSRVEVWSKSFEFQALGRAALSLAVIATRETTRRLGFNDEAKPEEQPRFLPNGPPSIKSDRPIGFRTRESGGCLCGGFDSGVAYVFNPEEGLASAEVLGEPNAGFRLYSGFRTDPLVLAEGHFGEDLPSIRGTEAWMRVIGVRVAANPGGYPLGEVMDTQFSEEMPAFVNDETAIAVLAGLPVAGFYSGTDASVTLSTLATDGFLKGYERARLYVNDKLYNVPPHRSVRFRFEDVGQLRVRGNKVSVSGRAKRLVVDDEDKLTRRFDSWSPVVQWAVPGTVAFLFGFAVSHGLAWLAHRLKKA